MIQAIPTWYAGCKFRSRLEARWAVAFDELGLQWEYEPEGYVLTERLTLGGSRIHYLPDFWLPGFDVFAEVKGSLDADECERLLNIAAAISSANGGGCHDDGGHDLAVLGPVPSVKTVIPVRLHMCKGCLLASTLLPQGSEGRVDPGSGLILATDVGGDDILESCEVVPPRAGPFHFASEYRTNLVKVSEFLLGGVTTVPPRETRWALGYAAARSARFEHGESGRIR